VRKNLFGTAEKPRLCVYRSLNNISVQIIDDAKGQTLAAASSLEKDVKARPWDIHQPSRPVNELIEWIGAGRNGELT
jgi:large subunit ribosomal protein L18